MILGALIDAGADPKKIERETLRAGAPPFELQVRSVRRGGLRGQAVDVIPREASPPFRTAADLLSRLSNGDLPQTLQRRSEKIFLRLVRAEARVHRRPEKSIHLHEVGAVDTFVDVVGAVVGLSLLGIDRVLSSAVNVGGGRSSKGDLPFPAPATAELLKGAQIRSDGTEAELATPTGAAILTSLAEAFCPFPAMTLEAVGYGAGTLNLRSPNLLRVMVGRGEGSLEEDHLQVIETQIDDMNPQFYDHVVERLFQAGALDVFLTPIIMKKGRPGILVTVLGELARLPGVIEVLLTETTTLGVRCHPVRREKLSRTIDSIRTPLGPVRVKTASWNGKVIHRLPEYEDLRALAEKGGLPLKKVWLDVLRLLPAGLKAPKRKEVPR